MKKLLAILLSVFMLMTFIACDKDDTPEGTDTEPATETQTETTADTQATTETETVTETETEDDTDKHFVGTLNSISTEGDISYALISPRSSDDPTELRLLIPQELDRTVNYLRGKNIWFTYDTETMVLITIEKEKLTITGTVVWMEGAGWNEIEYDGHFVWVSVPTYDEQGNITGNYSYVCLFDYDTPVKEGDTLRLIITTSSNIAGYQLYNVESFEVLSPSPSDNQS